MDLTADAIVCAVLPHGEHGAVIRLFTSTSGLIAGYVRGGRSRRLRPVLLPGNLVQANLRARVEDQLAAATVELLRSRAPLAMDRLTAPGVEWLCGLTASTLPEGHAYAQLHAALAGLLEVMDHAEDVRLWAARLVRYELLLLSQLGFALDLSECAATGSRDDLVFVSPKSSKAVSRAAGQPYADRLLPLPAFLAGADAAPDWPDILAGFRTTGYFLERDLLNGGRRADILAARERLLARLSAGYRQNKE
ncbi:DNA repair protein RecO [Sphingoaurantiacus capsulatus]|uniref:DNA repair protein RecO n=1 Tax=Sphingoaurantiacus capsulatus TaxID=1771310 RepID=A0ABV7X995_9SPHN